MQSELLNKLIKAVTIFLNIKKTCNRETILTQVEPSLYIKVSTSFKESSGGCETITPFIVKSSLRSAF